MKISVSYSELVSGPGYNNRQAKAEMEFDVTTDLNAAFDKAWKICKREVAKQLFPEKQNDFPEIPF